MMIAINYFRPMTDVPRTHTMTHSVSKDRVSFLTQSSQHVVTILKTVGTLIFNQHQSVKVLFEATFTKGQSDRNVPGQVKGCCSGSLTLHLSINRHWRVWAETTLAACANLQTLLNKLQG